MIDIDDDPARLDRALIHHWLSEHSHWARGIDRATVERSLANALCFGAYCERRQVGFARVITDRATFAYLADVFVLEDWRARGIARRLLERVRAHPDLQGLRRFALVTSSAHGLYERLGFSAVAHPERWMERFDPLVYQSAKELA